MPLPPKYRPTLRISSGEANEPRLRSSRDALHPFIAASLFSIFFLGGCAQESSNPQPEREQLEAAAERQSGDTEEEVEIYVRGDERSVERQIADASVAAQIRLALVDEQVLRPFDFEPTVVNGSVLLRGEVRTQRQRMEAERVARSVSGVREVINDVTATDEPVVAELDPSRDSLDSLLALGEEDERPGTGTESPGEAPDESVPSSSGAPASTGATGTDSTEPASAPEEEPEVHHTVRSGDSLWEIAREYGVTIDEIRRLNSLQSNRLMPGQRLRVK